MAWWCRQWSRWRGFLIGRSRCTIDKGEQRGEEKWGRMLVEKVLLMGGFFYFIWGGEWRFEGKIGRIKGAKGEKDVKYNDQRRW